MERWGRYAWAAVAALALGMGRVPAAHAAADCQDPAGIDHMPGFQLDHCEEKAWATLDLDLPGGGKTLEGRRGIFHYSYGSGDGPSNQALWDHYVKAFQAAGAKLMSDPAGGWTAVLQQGGSWYVYTHGDGNADVSNSYTITRLQPQPLAQEVKAHGMKAPLDVQPKSCANPPWLDQQFAYFKLDSCEGKAWDRLDVPLAGGDRTLEGKRLTVSYSLGDDSKEPVALAVQKNYIAALKTAGARLMSDPGHSSTAVLMQDTPGAEYWYVYQQGSGNEDSVGAYTLTTVEIAGFQQQVMAQALKAGLDTGAAKCADPPWLVKQFPYFKVSGCDNRDFDSLTVSLPGGDKVLAGRILATDYTLGDDKSDPTALFVHRNYVDALRQIGAEEKSDPASPYQAVLRQATAFGEFWYVYDHTTGNEQSTGSYRLTTIQVGGPPPKACVLKVYGVSFDFDKSSLRPDSEPVLQQLLALFQADPAYAAEIGGHTDNVGRPDYNLKLSGERAAAVKAWLLAHGVDGGRIAAQGYGDTRPLVPNSSDENRAKNRRVELKRNNCK